jgi:hypothetical protein
VVDAAAFFSNPTPSLLRDDNHLTVEGEAFTFEGLATRSFDQIPMAAARQRMVSAEARIQRIGWSHCIGFCARQPSVEGWLV